MLWSIEEEKTHTEAALEGNLQKEERASGCSELSL